MTKRTVFTITLFFIVSIVFLSCKEKDNYIFNDNFDYVTGNIPTGWILTGDGIGKFNINAYTESGYMTEMQLTQETGNFVALLREVSNTDPMKNKTFSFTCLVKPTALGTVNLKVNEGNFWYVSSNNILTNEWETLTVTGEIHPESPTVRCHIWLVSNSAVLIDSASLLVY